MKKLGGFFFLCPLLLAAASAAAGCACSNAGRTKEQANERINERMKEQEGRRKYYIADTRWKLSEQNRKGHLLNIARTTFKEGKTMNAKGKKWGM